MNGMSGMDVGLESRAFVRKLDHLAQKATKDLVSDGVLVSVLQENRLFSLGAFPSMGADLKARQHEAEETVCIHTARRGAVLEVEDARRDNELRNSRYVKEGSIIGYLGIPISLPNIGTIGSLCSISRSPKNWTALERGYLQQVAANAEMILLQEMNRLEIQGYSKSLTEVDEIVLALSNNTPVPMSIYDASGLLIFANAELLKLVPQKYVFNYQSLQEETSSKTPELMSEFVISSSTTESGLTVCSWQLGRISLH